MELTQNFSSLTEFRKHTVYSFTEQIFKVVQLYDDRERGYKRNKESFSTYEDKLDSSISRSKRLLLEYALCNKWDYFCTFTLSSERDRFDLNAWYKEFSQWLRDYRKKGNPVRYILVPEKHSDGAWHCHGLISGLDSSEIKTFRYLRYHGWKVDNKLVQGGYLCWLSYHDKFGFCSLKPPESAIACSFYITKYITKDNSRLVSQLGSHLFYSSHGLLKPDKLIEFYGRSPELDKLLKDKYEFCSTGFVMPRHEASWADFVSLAESFNICDFSCFEPLYDKDYESEVNKICDDFDNISLWGADYVKA